MDSKKGLRNYCEILKENLGEEFYFSISDMKV
jgi:hypothetical protein